MPPNRRDRNGKDEAPVMLSEVAVRNNYGVLEYSRTCQSATAGATAGILGLTATYGFLFYLASVFIQTVVWETKAGFRWSDYFIERSQSLTHSFVGGLFTYILFWVFLYGMVHVY